jgi:integrase
MSDFLGRYWPKASSGARAPSNAVANLEFEPEAANTRDVTPEQYDAVYRLANIRVQIAMDLADIIGQRRADILGIRPERDFTADGILIRQGKTGTPLIIEWTAALREVVDRALALKPDIPKVYLLRNRAGQRYTPRGFGAMWQKLMRKATRPGRNGAPPILEERFKFRDLRRKAATAKALATTEDEAKDLLGHTDVKTTRKHYLGERKPKKVTPVR